MFFSLRVVQTNKRHIRRSLGWWMARGCVDMSHGLSYWQPPYMHSYHAFKKTHLHSPNNDIHPGSFHVCASSLRHKLPAQVPAAVLQSRENTDRDGCSQHVFEQVASNSCSHTVAHDQVRRRQLQLIFLVNPKYGAHNYLISM